MRLRSSLALLSLIACVAACGGSGEGGMTNPPPPPPPPPPVKIPDSAFFNMINYRNVRLYCGGKSLKTNLNAGISLGMVPAVSRDSGQTVSCGMVSTDSMFVSMVLLSLTPNPITKASTSLSFEINTMQIDGVGMNTSDASFELLRMDKSPTISSWLVIPWNRTADSVVTSGPILSAAADTSGYEFYPGILFRVRPCTAPGTTTLSGTYGFTQVLVTGTARLGSTVTLQDVSLFCP